MASTAACLLFALVLVTLFLVRRPRSRSPVPLPPGPPSESILGHARVYPVSRQADAFQDFAKKYGDILYFYVFGQHLIVLNHYDDAVNLLEKRSAIYSDRADCTTFNLLGFGRITTLLRYGPKWRHHRRLLQDKLVPSSCVGYQDIQRREVEVLLRKLSGLKGSCRPAVDHFAISVPVEIAWGHRITSDDDEYFGFTRDAVEGLDAGAAGTSFLDVFPFLQHIPHWIPGCSWITEVPRKWRPAADKLCHYPFNVVMGEIRAGTARQCYVSDWIMRQESKGPVTQEDLEDIRDSAEVLFLGGYDTTKSSVETFIVLMAMFPDVQHKAQEEINRVVGPNRSPDFDDRSALLYLDCVLREVLRINPVISTGVPHRALQEDIYNDMRIPKGSVIIANQKAMCRDERYYREPDRFYPERFLPTPQGWGEKDLSIAFGFGRRICPGRHLATASLFLAAANILAEFDISTTEGEDANKFATEPSWTDAFTSHPENPECVITPRFKKAEALDFD